MIANFSVEIARLQKHLKVDGVMAYPTETVWGLGADAHSQKGIEKIFEIKGRDSAKAVSLLVRDIQMARRYGTFDRGAEGLMELFWSGPLTLVVPASKSVHKLISGESGNVGLRCSSHAWVRKFMSDYPGAITTTSANRSGEAPAKKREELDWLPPEVAVVDWHETAVGKGSTVVRVLGKGFTVLREGDLPLTVLERAASGILGLSRIY